MTATRFAFILCAPNDLRFSGFGQHAQNSQTIAYKAAAS